MGGDTLPTGVSNLSILEKPGIDLKPGLKNIIHSLFYRGLT